MSPKTGGGELDDERAELVMPILARILGVGGEPT
jgi:hypothetical protein